LRLAQPGDCAHRFSSCQIDDAQAVVAQLGDEQPLPLQIDAEMVDPAADLAERDLSL
jgi:hypothetical protein